MSKNQTLGVRLAMRVEGNWWVAYLAKIGTMDGAAELGRIKMACATIPSIKAATLDYYQKVMGEIIKVKFGTGVLWPTEPQPAPEHEKAGRA